MADGGTESDNLEKDELTEEEQNMPDTEHNLEERKKGEKNEEISLQRSSSPVEGRDASSSSAPRAKTVEDRALQAVLAARRRSIEMSKNFTTAEESETSKTGDEGDDPKECEELQAARNPLKWLTTLNTLYEQTKRSSSSIWKQRKPMFEPVKEITYREYDMDNQDVYVNQRTPSGDAKKGGKSKKHRKSKTGSKSAEAAKLQRRTRGGGMKDPEESSQRVRIRNTKVSLSLNRELQQKRRLLGHLAGRRPQEVYTDKDRAAAVTLGDQDIKTSLKVKQKNERRVVLPEDMDANVYLTEAQKNLTTGNLEAAFTCANKAVETGGPDPQCLLMRSRCSLMIGQLQDALVDAQEALKGDPSLIKALIVQAEALYTMGEFERALVLFHRGSRRRPDLAAFKKGIQKAREAILNAIGGEKFPEAKSGSGFTSFNAAISIGSSSTAGSPERMRDTDKKKLLDGTQGLDGNLRNKQGLDKMKKYSKSKDVNPLVTEIKTSKMVSKRLLGGLSSDKEFLSNLLARSDLSGPKLHHGVESWRADRRKSCSHIAKKETTVGGEIINEAKEALTSLQYLEAFLWQRDPGGLTSPPRIIPARHTRPPKKKRKPKSESRHKHQGQFRARLTLNEEQVALQTSRIDEKVSSLLLRLRTADGSSLSACVNEAEKYIDELRSEAEHNPSFELQLCRLLTGVGSALTAVGRNTDGIALLKDAVSCGKQRCFAKEERKALEQLALLLSKEGQYEEAIDAWLTFEEQRLRARESNEENFPDFNLDADENEDHAAETNNNNTAWKQEGRTTKSLLRIAVEKVRADENEAAEEILRQLWPEAIPDILKKLVSLIIDKLSLEDVCD